jgi:hypothetical protein
MSVTDTIFHDIGNYCSEVVFTNASASVGSLTYSNCQFAGIGINGILISSSANTIDQINIEGCSFTGGNRGVLSVGVEINRPTVSLLSISDCAFTDINTACSIDSGSTIRQGSFANNSFNVNSANGLVITTSTANNVISITNNTFTSTLTSSLGYAADIINNSGSLCLNFVNNVATPVNLGGGVNPYYFNNMAGTFNLTAESTAANNTGTITSSGISGTCTP